MSQPDYDSICLVVNVEPMYVLPASGGQGVWRVTVGFHNRGTATFCHTGCVEPKVGEAWEFREPRLLRKDAS